MKKFGIAIYLSRSAAVADREKFEYLFALWGSRWDDYGSHTLFKCYLHSKGTEVEIEPIRIAISGSRNTEQYLLDNTDLRSKSSLFFPIDDLEYLSLPTSVSFYERLQEILTPEETIEFLTQLGDMVLKKKMGELEKTTIEPEVIQRSLLRDTSAQKALMDGEAKIFPEIPERAKDFSFSFAQPIYRTASHLKFDFNFKPGDFPNRINLIIGKNGLGKTHVLRNIVKSFFEKEQKDRILSARRGYFANVIYLSYSPFDTPFVSDNSSNTNFRNTPAFKSFSFYRHDNGEFDKEQPRSDAAYSILSILSDEIKQQEVGLSGKRFAKLNHVLAKAIKYSYLGLCVKPDAKDLPNVSEYSELGLPKRHFFLFNTLVPSDQIDEISKHIIPEAGVHFFDDQKKMIPLSSGQKLFTYSVFNIISSIVNESLVVLDEPELYLHPNLIVEIVVLLKELLEAFNSYALVATHSLIIAREVPRKCTSIIKEAAGQVVVRTPEIETFGADIEKICEVIFGDMDLEKPFQEWLDDKFSSLNMDQVLESASILNDESLSYILGKIK